MIYRKENGGPVEEVYDVSGSVSEGVLVIYLNCQLVLPVYPIYIDLFITHNKMVSYDQLYEKSF